MEFEQKGHDILEWYVDGRIVYHKNDIKNVKNGITELDMRQEKEKVRPKSKEGNRLPKRLFLRQGQ